LEETYKLSGVTPELTVAGSASSWKRLKN